MRPSVTGAHTSESENEDGAERPATEKKKMKSKQIHDGPRGDSKEPNRGEKLRTRRKREEETAPTEQRGREATPEPNPRTGGEALVLSSMTLRQQTATRHLGGRIYIPFQIFLHPAHIFEVGRRQPKQHHHEAHASSHARSKQLFLLGYRLRHGERQEETRTRLQREQKPSQHAPRKV